MNYKIKSEDLFIYDKETIRHPTKGNIIYINWYTDFETTLEDAVVFDEEETEFMTRHYNGLKLFEV